MDEFWRSQARAFGSWDRVLVDEYNELPYSHCFDLAAEDKLFRRSYSQHHDFLITSKLYDDNVEKTCYNYVKDAKKEGWMVCPVKQPPSYVSAKPRKPVDADLYKISPELLRYKPKKPSVRGFFSMCLGPCASCEDI